MKSIATAGLVIISVFSLSGCFEETKSVDWWLAHPKETYKKFEECQKSGSDSDNCKGTVAKLAMRQPFVLFKGLTFQKLCLPGAFRPGDHHNKMLRPGLCVVHASPQYL